MKQKERPVVSNILIEDARIIFRNFAGAESRYNAAGRRNFCLIIPNQEMAEALVNDGWNIKYLRPRDEEEVETPYLKVNVGFNSRPPKVVVISSSGRELLDEDTIGALDWADINTIDLVVRPYPYDINGRSGISAYLKSMYVTLDEDDLEQKYANPSALVEDDRTV